MAGKQYAMMFQIGAKTQSQFNTAFKGAASKVASLQSQIEQLNRKQGDIAAYQKQQKALEKTSEKLARLRQQYEELKRSETESGEASTTLKNKLLDKEKQIEKASGALDQQSARLNSMGKALEEAGVDTQNLGSASAELTSQLSALRTEQEQSAQAAQEMAQANQSASDAMELLAATGAMEALKKSADILMDCADASIAYESSMAAVKRTVGGSDAFLDGMKHDFMTLSTQIPMTTGELAEIAMTAGQLGIAQQSVESFTTVMAKLGTTTDLSASDAASMLAQFANITHLTDYERMGAVVADLGDATATTASKVVEMSQGMAAAATQAGMKPTDIMAIAAAVGSLGIEAQAGSTAMSTLISTLHMAVETGSDTLNEYAAIAGMTAGQFSQAWKTDAVSAMDAFIRGLNNVEQNGRSATVILDELGINNVRQTKAILGLSSAGDLLTGTIAQANRAWQQNTALNEKANVMYTTTEAKLTMAANAANNVKIAIGDGLTPIMGGLAEAATGMLNPTAEWISKNPALVRGVAGAGTAIGAAGMALTGFAAASKLAAAGTALLTATIPGLPVILGVVGGVAALTGVVAGLSAVVGDSTESFEDLDEQFDHINRQIQEQQDVIDLVDEYRRLSRELGYTASAADDLANAGGTVTITPVAGEPIDTASLVTGDATFTINASAGTKLAAGDFVPPEGMFITLDAQRGQTLAAADLLQDGTTVYLTPAAYERLEAAGLVDGSEVPIKPVAEGTIATDDMVQGLREVQLTPAAAEYITSTDFLDEGGAMVQLTPAVAQALQADALLDGTTVSLSAEAANELKATGFLDGTGIILDATATKDVAAGDFVTGTEVALTGSVAENGALAPDSLMTGTTVDLTGKANKNINAGDFVTGTGVVLTGSVAENGQLSPDSFVTDTVIGFTGSITNLADLQAQAAALQSSLTTIGTELTDAQTELTDMQTRAGQLDARYENAPDEKTRTTLKAQIGELGEAMSAQQAKVDRLRREWDLLDAEYQATNTAANDLAAKEERLADVKAQLVQASGGVITATDGETEAFAQQAGIAEALALSKQAELRQQAYDVMTRQSAAYAKAIGNETQNTAELNAATERQTRMAVYAGMTTAQLNEQLTNAVNGAKKASKGNSFDSSEVQQYVHQVEDLLYIMTGKSYNLKNLTAVQNMTKGVTAETGDATAAWKEVSQQVVQYQQAVTDAQATQQTYLDNLVDGVKLGGMSMEQVEEILHEQFDRTANGAQIVADAMNYVRQAVADAAEATENYAAGTTDSTANVTQLHNAINPILDDMNELGKAYQDVYDSAYANIGGTGDIFVEVKREEEANIDAMIDGMKSNIRYMETYAENLQKARSMGLDEGLLSYLSDGTAQSAEYLDAIIQKGEGKIDELNETFAGVQAGKDAFASTVADMQTDFDAQMAAMQEELEAAIAEMDMSADAAQAGADTVAAFANAALAGMPAVATAFSTVAARATLALRTAGSGTTGASLVGAHYASGTDDARRGVALVGEEGPELVWFGGGERVTDAKTTAAMMDAPGMGGAVFQVTVSPSFNVSGNGGDMQTMLNECVDNLRELVENTMRDMQNDYERSAYSR